MHVATLALLLCSALGVSSATPTRRATTCNGHAELCARSYGNVTFLGTHNSYAVGGEVADNQGWNVTTQLVSSSPAEVKRVV